MGVGGPAGSKEAAKAAYLSAPDGGPDAKERGDAYEKNDFRRPACSVLCNGGRRSRQRPYQWGRRDVSVSDLFEMVRCLSQTVPHNSVQLSIDRIRRGNQSGQS